MNSAAAALASVAGSKDQSQDLNEAEKAAEQKKKDAESKKDELDNKLKSDIAAITEKYNNLPQTPENYDLSMVEIFAAYDAYIDQLYKLQQELDGDTTPFVVKKVEEVVEYVKDKFVRWIEEGQLKGKVLQAREDVVEILLENIKRIKNDVETENANVDASSLQNSLNVLISAAQTKPADVSPDSSPGPLDALKQGMSALGDQAGSLGGEEAKGGETAKPGAEGETAKPGAEGEEGETAKPGAEGETATPATEEAPAAATPATEEAPAASPAAPKTFFEKIKKISLAKPPPQEFWDKHAAKAAEGSKLSKLISKFDPNKNSSAPAPAPMAAVAAGGGQSGGGSILHKQPKYINQVTENRNKIFKKELEIINSIRRFHRSHTIRKRDKINSALGVRKSINNKNRRLHSKNTKRHRHHQHKHRSTKHVKK